MREILFRGKLSHSGQWNEGNLIISCNRNTYIIQFESIEPDGHHLFIEDKAFWVKSETVGQFIGLLDKNGKKIFEGDLFKLGSEKEIFEVRFEYGCFMAFLCGQQYGLIGELQICFIEVIGNIHDNPELLK